MNRSTLISWPSLRVTALLVAAASLAQAADWQLLPRVIANQSGQALSLNAFWNVPHQEMDLGYKLIAGADHAAPEGEPKAILEAPITVPDGQRLQLYFRFIDACHPSGSAFITVNDASGNTCSNMILKADPSASALDPPKALAGSQAQAQGLSHEASWQTGVKVDWSSPVRVVFKDASGAQAGVESKDSGAAGSMESKRATGMAGSEHSAASQGGKEAVAARGAAAAGSLESKNPVETKGPAAASRVESKGASGTAGLDPSQGIKTLIIGEKPRTRLKCTLGLSESKEQFILTAPEGQAIRFEVRPEAGTAAESKLPVDIIGDISGSMEEPLANDTERKDAVPRSKAHELIYRAVRKAFPGGRNLVFDATVRSWNMEGPMPQGGSTSLVDCLQACK